MTDFYHAAGRLSECTKTIHGEGARDAPARARIFIEIRGLPWDKKVKAACGQFGDRVEHARMRWTRKGADGLHVVKAAILSGDGRWERRHPAPIPVLQPEAPAAAGAG